MKRHILIYSLLLLALLCPAALKAGNYVIINQVMYDTPLSEVAGQKGAYNGEFIELYNAGPEEVSLHGWSVLSLSGKNKKETLRINNASIPSGGYLLLASRQGSGNNFVLSDLYQSLANNDYTAIYHGSFVLANTKETLILLNAQNDTIDQVTCGSDTKLKAKNGSNTAGDNCISIHRSNVDFDENGKMIAAKTAWTSGNVSFGTNQLPQEMFGSQTIFSHKPPMGGSSAGGDNYIVTVTPLDATNNINITKEGISANSNIRTKTSIQYYDGLGRPNELVAVGVTPSKKDLVSTTVYNGLHRVTQKWLPVPMDTKGAYTDVKNVQDRATQFFSDRRPYTESIYENSALNRVAEQIRVGEDFASHPSKNTYSINKESDRVRIYSVVRDSVLKVRQGDYYAANTLYKTIVTDEDGKFVTTYTDKLGRKIMEERAGNEMYRTYFVYDDLGRLRFVLPHIYGPNLVDGEFNLSDETLRAACYCYKYDDRGNMIYKRLPGCEPQLMVYDMAGQLVFKQDGNQRAKDRLSWTYFAYDSLGRNVYTATGRSVQQESQINHFANKTSVDDWMNSGRDFASGEKVGYDRGKRILSGKLLSVNYYDTYDFLENEEEGLEYKDGYDAPYNNATGLLTGTRVYNLSEPGYTTTIYYYDDKGRVVQTRSRRSRDRYETITSSKYNFDGSVAETKTVQGIGTDKVTEHYGYTYDHAGRAKDVKYKLNNKREETLSAFSYDIIGRLAQNLLYNGKDAINYYYGTDNSLSDIDNKHFSEKLFYAKKSVMEDHAPHAQPCYNGNIAAIAMEVEDDRVYTFDYTYDNQNRLVEATQEYNKTTRPVEWFQYDARGNIRRLQRYSGPRRMDDLEFDYDENSNQVKEIFEDGNDADRQGVIEYTTKNRVYGLGMQYDKNGNLICDGDRGISRISYNILNLPDTIHFINGNEIISLYDAAGCKYKSIVYTASAPKSTSNLDLAYSMYDTETNDFDITEYSGNIQTRYTPLDTTRRIFNSTGYYDSKTNAYYHYIKDHIGNVCAVVNSAVDTTIQSTIYYPSGVPMAKSLGRNVSASQYNAMGIQETMNFGLDEQPYLYNGKEYITAHDLNEYDSQARRYYASIMRTTTMDPLAEFNYHISPYAWCNNDPINKFDPDGRAWKNTKDEKTALREKDQARLVGDRKLQRMKKLYAQRAKCGSMKKQAAIDRKIMDYQNQIIRLNNLIKNIDLLTNSETVYSFKTCYGTGEAKAVYLEKDEDGTIIINNLGSYGSIAHEITHAAQYENGWFTFEKTSEVISYSKDNPNLAIELEIEAYQTEYSIDGYVSSQTERSQPGSSLDIDYQWVTGIPDPTEGGSMYNPTGDKSTNPLSGLCMPWEKEPEMLGL